MFDQTAEDYLTAMVKEAIKARKETGTQVNDAYMSPLTIFNDSLFSMKKG